MKLIVGLGNPGKKYDRTRHNVGFDALDRLADKWQAGPRRARFESLTAECQIAGHRALLLWPQTYMNRSGLAVSQAVGFYKLPLENLLVICDDFNLPLGKLRLRAQGSSGGQNGLKDILRALSSEEWPRLRIGVGPVPVQWDPADFVLSRFAKQEAEEADALIDAAAQAVAAWAEQGVTQAMNRYN